MKRSVRLRLFLAYTVAAAISFACGTKQPTPSDSGDGSTPPQPDAGEPITGPTNLSETGLYADFPSRTLAAGVIRYSPRFELWSDGADKARFLLLPAGTTIDTSDMDNWVFPVGTKAWK